jgi:hypothetical protein
MQFEYIQLYANMGHPHLNNETMLKDDFYVLVTKNHKIGLRKKLSKSECIIFKIEEQQMSDYIQVANICGSQIKYIQLANIIGNKEDHKPNMVKNDFYTLCMKNPKDNLGLRSNGMIVLKKDEVVLDYLCSDFARFCLALYKNNQHNDGGNMALIPKQPIPISEELKQYIREYLPDYYDNRTNRK